ncbi:DUF3352 domain-containing protein [Nocardioides sp. URHA0020]|uniref:DUF3352 domain-containing protein n=1 Tax=Nocardioides sp. URHA0020 TaxID=1380392 RepID=UPI000A891762|nr:DUF3352 domain-containing protein [Nocardioides sp. URHA0020]
MSYDLPPGPPPSGPPVGPPAGAPETLDSRGGAPLPATGSSRGGRRTTVLAIGGAIGAVAVGGVAWAAWSFFATGAQPAEALPGSTLAYASIDLDPNGGQKIEALRTLQKFPGFKDEVGIDTDDDIREWIFEQIQQESGCKDLDYGDDIEPWLGDRFAVAAVDTGKDGPAPVVVVQVSDDDKADQGLTKLLECGGGDSDAAAWAISDGWALIGESQQVVDGIADDADDSSLADDDDFQKWTGAAGDTGIVSMYAAPEAGTVLADQLSSGLGDLSGLSDLGDEAAAAPDDMTAALKDFKGAAATVRFDDGGLELEVAADPAATGRAITAGDAGAQAVSTLPDDTAAAIGLSFADGWAKDLVEQIAKATGESADDLLAQAEDELGLDLPDDVETLVGDSMAIAVDAGFDPSSFAAGESDGGATGVGVKIVGDADGIEGVLSRLQDAAGGADGGVLDHDSDGGAVAVGPDPLYRKQLLEDGGLGDSATFRKVVEHADDAAAVVYLDFDAGDDWLVELAGDDAEVRDNLEPLDALGMSAWVDDDTAHTVLKITTD